MFTRTLIVLLGIALALPGRTDEPPGQKPADLTGLQIEDLMKIKVTTASRESQPLFSVAAAMSVITHDDIRRSGVTTVPDALRMVPGVQVAQIDANKWAVSIRGFGGRYTNNLLVMIDGRTIYTALFSGVVWEEQDLLLDEIDRIEVIRGPGGLLWGANAVNGVINIITRNSDESQGDKLTARTGNRQSGSGSFRHGGRLGSNGTYRIYGKYTSHGPTQLDAGGSAHDGWDGLRGGFRVDMNRSATDEFFVAGDVFHERIEELETLPTLPAPFTETLDATLPFSGWDLIGRWTRKSPSGAKSTLQLNADHANNAIPEVTFARSTFEVDFQHQLAPAHGHNVVWGAGYRYATDQFSGTFAVRLVPPSASYPLYSGFVQDEIALRDHLRLTLGTKVEHNAFTGIELQPNVRVAWRPDERHMLWGSVARAVRTPSRSDRDAVVIASVFPGQGGIPNVVEALADNAMVSSTVLAYEIGYRIQPTDRLTLDLSAFYNKYWGLTATNPGQPFVEASPAPLHVVIPMGTMQGQSANTAGLEAATRLQVSNRWNLAATYALLTPVGGDSAALDVLHSPRYQVNLQSNTDLGRHVSLGVQVSEVGKISDMNVPGYTWLGANVAWRPRRGLELSLGGTNLLYTGREQFGPDYFANATRIPRVVYGKATWSF